MERRYNYPNYRQIAGLIIFLSLIITGNVTAVEFDGGTGEPNDPYLISTAEQLQAIGDETLYEKCFMLVADIDLDPNLPGNEILIDHPFIDSFYGTLDGNGHSISNMVAEDDPNTYVSFAEQRHENPGLIGFLSLSGIVKDIQLQNITILGIGHEVGALVSSNRGKILRCSVTGSVCGESFVGGLVGSNNGDIVSCSAFCDVQSVPGGAVGFAGGLAGYNYGSGRIYNCYAMGTITGVEDVGGLVGATEGCYISNCYAICTVTGCENVGGLIGENRGYIYNCYARGTITGDKSVGGLIGYHRLPSIYSIISQCYAACVIVADSNDSVGGLIGKSSGQAINSFWDTQISGQEISAGGDGLPTEKMQNTETYLDAGWDITGETSDGLADIWTIAEPNSYPQLTRFSDQYPVIQLPGSGTEDDPYEITTVEDLAAINYYDIDAYYALVADIDLSGIVWSNAPISFFDGTFDGRGHTISNLTIYGGSYLGLFGRILSDGVVTNLTIQDACVIGDYLIGTFAGSSYGYITNCHATGSVSGESGVGGLVGMVNMLYSTFLFEYISDCTADVVVSGNDYVDDIANISYYD